MIKTYSFKTQRGADIDLAINVNHITSETVECDGITFEKACSYYTYTVLSISVNGKEYSGKFNDAAKNICIGYQGNRPILVALPESVKNDIVSEERTESKIRNEKATEADKAYTDHCNMIKKAMAE